MTELVQKYWNMDYLTEKHLAGFDSYKVSAQNPCYDVNLIEASAFYLVFRIYETKITATTTNPFRSINFSSRALNKPEYNNYIIPFEINRQFCFFSFELSSFGLFCACVCIMR